MSTTWQTMKLKHVVSRSTEKSAPDSTLPFVGLEHIASGTGEILGFSEAEETAEESASLHFTSSDVLFGKLRPYLAKAARPDFDGRCSSEFLVLRPKINRSYFFYYCLSDEFLSAVNASTFGAKMPRSDWDFIGQCEIRLPDETEQETVSAFLDERMDAIDQLIAKKQRMLELLDEKRLALISQTVTKGLDPTAKMKQTNVPWLSEVPEHWRVLRLRFVASLNPGKSEVPLLGQDVSFLPMEKIGEDGQLDISNNRSIEEVYNGYTYFKENDVLVAKITPCFENGKGGLARGLANGLGFGTTELHVIRAGHETCARFIWWLTRGYQFRVVGEAMMQGAAGQKRVPEDFIKDWFTPLPPPEEQIAIAEYLDRSQKKHEALVNKVRSQIELLREYRRALIAAAVTGKIDVTAERSGAA